MLRPCSNLLHARCLHVQEVPVRLAHRISDLSRLPPKLAAQPQVQRVKGW